MDETTARIIAYSILSVGTVAWLFALRILLGMQQPTRQASSDFSMDSAEELVDSHSVTVALPPTELVDRLVKQVASGNSSLGPTRIVERKDDLIRLAGGDPRYSFREAVLNLAPIQSGSRVTINVDIGARQWLLPLAGLFLILSAIVIGVLWYVMETWVIPSPKGAVRWQVVQCVQMIHFLWPPFVLIFVVRHARTVVEGRLMTLVSNLPYVE